MDELVGITLEWRAQQRLSSWLGRVLEKMKVRPPGGWAEVLRERVGPEPFDEVLDTDLIARARLRHHPRAEIWLAIEVSGVVDRNDVERTLTRTMIFAPHLHSTIPVVGKRATEGAVDPA